MQIISLSNQVIRKALQLSLVEMAVLCDIKQMSQSERYSYWCVKSKDKMAEWFDLSRTTIFNALNSLEAKGYIERSQIGVRPTKFIIDLDCAQEEIGIYIKNNDVELISAKIKESLDYQSKNCTTSPKIGLNTVQKLDSTQSKNWTQDIIEKEEEFKEKEKIKKEKEVPSFVEADRQKAREFAEASKQVSIEELTAQLKADTATIELLCINHKIKPPELNAAINHFKNYLSITGKQHNRIEFRSHFANWLPKNLDKAKVVANTPSKPKYKNESVPQYIKDQIAGNYGD